MLHDLKGIRIMWNFYDHKKFTDILLSKEVTLYHHMLGMYSMSPGFKMHLYITALENSKNIVWSGHSGSTRDKPECRY